MIPAYCYSRVSTTNQSEHGHGLARQVEIAKDFLTAHPEYKLTDTILDKGKSAYYGKNITQGGLGNFIEQLKDGTITAPCLMVIEDCSRLSRLPSRKAREVINTLLDLECSIAIVKYNLIVSSTDGDDCLSSDILLTAALHLANRESKDKSNRIKHNLKMKRDAILTDGTKYTSQCPSWLRYNKTTKSFDTIPPHVAIVTRIFELKSNGAGFESIAKTLNSENIINFSGRSKFWNKTGIKNIITQRKVLGYYQPHESIMKDGKRINIPVGDEIPNYFPQIITETLWKSANATIKPSTKGNTGNYKNIFRGLLRCPNCGDTLALKSKNANSPTYLTCNGKKFKKGCNRDNTRYEVFEESAIKAFTMFDASKLKQVDTAPLEHDLQQAIQARENVLTMIEQMDDVSLIGSLKTRLEACQGTITTIQKEIDTLTFNAGNKSVVTPITTEERQLFNLTLKRYVESISVGDSGYKVKFKNREWSVTVDYDSDDVDLTEMYNSGLNELEFDFVR